MEQYLSIRDIDLQGKKVLVRVDFNVPMDEEGNIRDDARIQAAIPTIRYILDQGASLILMSHHGRPKGKKNLKNSLQPCAQRLQEILGSPVIFAADCVGSKTKQLAENLQVGAILLLENLRFHHAEEKPESDLNFAKELASLGEVYVNDAFGSAHRAHSSIVPITSYFPGHSVAGLLMEKEIRHLSPLVKNPERPFFALIGGAKVSSKIGVLKSLVKHADALIIGGGMAFTFLKVLGYEIGDSLFEEEFLDEAKEVITLCKSENTELILPRDLVIANTFSNEADTRTIEIEEGIPRTWQGLDIGPKSIEIFSYSLKKAKTVLWNGPMGVFEFPQFAKGTFAITKELAQSSAQTIVGGGDSVAAIQATGFHDSFDHISTGGGASLEFIEFGNLPGIEALSKQPSFN
ncbi:MAG: phosphoglycerate kinase [Waddliaceae bacterium]|nr:phosphoglycerate kinase [Waddliaceae bacterium]